MAANWILINTDTNKEIKRCPRLPTIDQSMPKGMGKNLQWFPIVRSTYPTANENQGMTYKEEIKNGKLHIDFLTFEIKDGRTKPIEIAK